MAKSVCGLVLNETQAGEVVNLLRLAGFSNHDISALLPDKTGPRDFGYQPHTKAAEGAIAGGAAGALLFGAFGWLTTTGAIVFPGAGPLVVAGPVLAALSCAAVGIVAGELVGAFLGAGVTEFVARRFEGKIAEGNILLSVHCDNNRRARAASDIFERAGARSVGVRGEARVKRLRRFAPPRPAI